MKATIHPIYYPDAKIVCACGHEAAVGSTIKEVHVELCSHCHPFYTGQQKFLDTSGRIDRFQAQAKVRAAKAGTVTGKKAKTVKRAAQKAVKKAAKQTIPVVGL